MLQNKRSTPNYSPYISFSDFSTQKLTKKILEALEGPGWVVVTGFAKDTSSIQQKSLFIDLCKKIGQPIGHDRNGKIVWDIKPRQPDTYKKGVVTFSEHNHEADLHTDSQYSEYPEDYFALLTLKPASCGGGESSLLSLPAILEELQLTAEGLQHLRVLEKTKFPFIVPRAFQKKNSKGPEFSFGTIIRPNEIRFRIDTVEKALAYDPGFCTAEQVEAFDFLKDLIRNSSKTKNLFLKRNDLIFINNKTMLHGRGSFKDRKRHLLRIRMNKF